MITPDLYQEIVSLAELFKRIFSPPEFVPGCEVMSVTDKNLYAANNGWVEAICGQHNQQRVRWKSNETVIVGSFIDVLYFPDRRLFEAYGIGGGGAITPPGIALGAWLEDISTGFRVYYATLTAAITAMGAGDIFHLEAGTYTGPFTFNKNGTLRGSAQGDTILTQGTDGTTLILNTAGAIVEDLTIINTLASGTVTAIGITASCRLRNVIAQATGATTTGYGITINGATVDLIGCEVSSTGATTRIGLDLGASAVVNVYGGVYNGATYDILVDSSTLNNYGALLTHNILYSAGSAMERSGHISFERARLNPIINGAPLVWQRGTSFAAVASGDYTADRWRYQVSGAMVHTITRDASAPTIDQAGVLVPYSIKLDCTTADASIAAGDQCFIETRIEGYNWLYLAQRQFTLSFWVRDTKTGVHCVAVRNSGTDRSFVAEYTINAADTWEYKTVTVPASPSAGTWDYTTGIGARIDFVLACGSTLHTTAGTWQTGNFIATSSQVNATDSTANNFYLTLVKIEPGAVATPFLLPDYGPELARCKPYCWALDAASNTVDQGFGSKAASNQIFIQFTLPGMRTTPTLFHNVTGYTGGAPGTTTIALVNYATNAFFAITGALTIGLNGGNKDFAIVKFQAGTSWDGTGGNVATLRLGPSVVAGFSAEL